MATRSLLAGTVTLTGAFAGARVTANADQRALATEMRMRPEQRTVLAHGTWAIPLIIDSAIEPRVVADCRNSRWPLSCGQYGFAIGRSASDLGPATYPRCGSAAAPDHRQRTGDGS